MAKRVAVVGTGRIAEAHFAGYEKAGADIIAVVDVDEQRARDRAERYGANAYTDMASMLQNETIDAVSICTPPFAHAEQVILAARHGVHIFSEKPFALTSGDARTMLDAVKGAGIVLATNFAHRSFEGTTIAREMIADGTLGDIHSLRVRFGVDYTQNTRGWIYRKDLAGGGTFMDTASHGLDLYRYLIADIDRVYAISRQTPAAAEVEDLGAWIVESNATPAFGIIESDWPTPGADYGWSLHGSNGALYADYTIPGLRYRFTGGTEWTLIALPQDAVVDRFTRAVANFLDCIDSGDMPIATGEDGLRSLEIIEAAYRSAEEGCAVESAADAVRRD
jgi:UDP-N-acetylglucosamine 3-dehydrogenase